MDLFQPRMGKHPTEIFETRRGPPDGSTPDYLRLVHQYFDQRATNVATVDDLTAYIRGQYSSEKDEICVSARLHHVTLPKLATGGLIDYDPRSNMARYWADSPSEGANERKSFDRSMETESD